MEVLDKQLVLIGPWSATVGGAADCAMQLPWLIALFYRDGFIALSSGSGGIRRTHARPAYRQVMGMG